MSYLQINGSIQKKKLSAPLNIQQFSPLFKPTSLCIIQSDSTVEIKSNMYQCS